MEHVDLRAGVVLSDRFLLRQALGRGSFSSVWRADDRRDGRAVALKILHAEVAGDRDTVMRFQREASVLASLEHPGIAKAFSLEVEGPIPFIVMELVEGRELSDELAEHVGRSSFLSRSEELEIIDQIAGAVGHAHGVDLLHRDLKPRNVMIRRSPAISIRILDFGLAKLMFDSPTLATTLGRRLGSILYMSPEQARGSDVDHRTDVFALGCIFFELLTLTRAWAFGADGRRLGCAERAEGSHNSPFAVAERIARADRPKATAFRPDLPPEVDAVLARAMAPSRDARTGSAAELASELRSALAEQRPMIRASDEEARWGTRVTGPPAGSVGAASEVPAADPAPSPPTVNERRLSSPRPARQVIRPAPGRRARSPIGTVLAVVAVGVAAFAAGTLHGRFTAEVPIDVRAPEVRDLPPARVSATPLPVEPAAPPPMTPPRTPRPLAAERAPEPPPIEGPPPKRHRLDALLAEAKADPSDLRRMRALEAAILTEADAVPDERARASIRRRTAVGAAVADLEALERCVAEILAVAR